MPAAIPGVEHHETEAARAEQDVGGAERVGSAAWPHPEEPREHHAGGADGLGLERVVHIDPGDGLAGLRGMRRDGAREPRPAGAPLARELDDASAGQAATERPVETGKPRRQPADRLRLRRPQADVPRPAELVEQGGGRGHDA